MSPNRSSKKKLEKQISLLSSSVGPYWGEPTKPRRSITSGSESPTPSGDPGKRSSSPSRKRRSLGRSDSFPDERPQHSRSASTSQPADITMSQRNRGQRTANRNNEVGEEYGLWRTVEGSLNSMAAAVNESSQNVDDIVAQDKLMIEKKNSGDHDKRDSNGKTPGLCTFLY